tara:strand:- start:89 stop:304 length:216 start_codon:yes stop_codon:yes gene_type:complete
MTINSKGINERLRVWNGSMKKTSGGLTKSDLKKNKQGLIVSRKASDAAKKRYNSKKFAHVKAAFKKHEIKK